MQKANSTAEKLVITYAHKKNTTKPRRFHLGIGHVASNPINFTLSAEKRPNEQWRPLSVEIDAEETFVDLSLAYTSLADLQWHIFNRKERDRVLAPIVGLWEEDELYVVACLSDRYGGMRLPFVKQEAWFLEENSGTNTLDVPDPSRLLCWWPDTDAWDMAKQIVKNMASIPGTNSIDINFFTFSEWLARPDINKWLAEYFVQSSIELQTDTKEYKELFAEIQIEYYAQYLRRLRTMFLYFRQKNIPTRVMLGNNKQAAAYFAQNNLSPYEPMSWASVSHIFEMMPEFVFEQANPFAPLYIVNPTMKLTATVYFICHLEDSPIADAIGVIIYTAKQQIANLVAWLNPLSDIKAYDAALDEIVEKLISYGVEDISILGGNFPPGTIPSINELIGTGTNYSR